jgi:hydrogenase maturation protease
MPRTLVIGYGNIHRADDGVAHHIIGLLRKRLGQAPLGENDTGLDNLGAETDSISLTQLIPELIDTLVDYDQIIFVDAHVRDDVPDLHHEMVSAEYVISAFTHHMTPAMLLALLKAIHHREPAGHIMSIRGHDFDFHDSLSASAQALVEPAVNQILRLVASVQETQG